jgi:hypothetical protein
MLRVDAEVNGIRAGLALNRVRLRLRPQMLRCGDDQVIAEVTRNRLNLFLPEVTFPTCLDDASYERSLNMAMLLPGL